MKGWMVLHSGEECTQQSCTEPAPCAAAEPCSWCSPSLWWRWWVPCPRQALAFLLLSSQLRRWASNARHSNSTSELTLLQQQPQRENNLLCSSAVWLKKVRESYWVFSFRKQIVIFLFRSNYSSHGISIEAKYTSAHTPLTPFSSLQEKMRIFLIYFLFFNFWGLCFVMIFL